MREASIKQDQDGLHLLRRRLLVRHVDARAPHPQDRADQRGPGQRHLDVRQGQVRLGLRQQPGAAHRAAHPRGGHDGRAPSARRRGTRRSTQCARRMRAIADEHGPDSRGVHRLVSKATNEEAYLVQKMARAVFGTNSVDNCAATARRPATMGLWRTVGYGGDAGTMDDIRAADLVLIVGTNTARATPSSRRASARRAEEARPEAHRRRHPRATRWPSAPTCSSGPSPGPISIWLSAVTKHIFDQGWEDRDFLDQWVHHEASTARAWSPSRWSSPPSDAASRQRRWRTWRTASRTPRRSAGCGPWA